jgi:WhiB family redox-sensing transcriptional regulator
MTTRRRSDVETYDVGSAEPGGATETQRPDIAVALMGGNDLAAADGAWRELALCAQVDPELWFPEKGESPAAAKLLCGRCEVRAECLELALETNEQFGIWGGLSSKERRGLRRRRRLRLALQRAGAALPFDLDEPGCGLSLPGGEAA